MKVYQDATWSHSVWCGEVTRGKLTGCKSLLYLEESDIRRISRFNLSNYRQFNPGGYIYVVKCKLCETVNVLPSGCIPWFIREKVPEVRW